LDSGCEPIQERLQRGLADEVIDSVLLGPGFEARCHIDRITDYGTRALFLATGSKLSHKACGGVSKDECVFLNQ